MWFFDLPWKFPIPFLWNAVLWDAGPLSVFHCAFLSDVFLAFLGAPCLTMTFVASCVGLRKEKLCWRLCRQGLWTCLWFVMHPEFSPARSFLMCYVGRYCVLGSQSGSFQSFWNLSASGPEALSTLKFIVLLRAMHLSCLSAGPFWGLKHGWTEGHTAGAQIGSCCSGSNFTCKCSKSWPLHLRLDHHTWQNLPSDGEVASERSFLSVLVSSVVSLGVLVVVRRLLANLPAGPSSCFESPWAAIRKHWMSAVSLATWGKNLFSF